MPGRAIEKVLEKALKVSRTGGWSFGSTWLVMALLAVGLGGLAGCDPDNPGFLVLGSAPTTAPTPAATATPPPTATVTVAPTVTATTTAVPPTATATPTPIRTSTATQTAKPTATATATQTIRPTATPTATGTPVQSATATPKATATVPPAACLPPSSIAVLVQGTNATAYAPQGTWQGGEGTCSVGGSRINTTGIKVVLIETSSGIGKGGPPATISTKNPVNSCSSNSVTGQTVCVANTTDVYLVTGSTLTNTLASGATTIQTFSGGSCENCGVVVDASTNKALLTVGLGGAGFPAGYQFLDLGTAPPTFEPPIPAGVNTSEDVSIDPIRKLVLSPNETDLYQIVDFKAGTTKTTLFNHTFPPPLPTLGILDSAAEDCTTGIALSSVEFIRQVDAGDILITDLTQATFTPGSPGTWSAPFQYQNLFPDMGLTNAGTDGIAVAPGTHFGVVTGEFGDNVEGVFQLPSTSGTGTPAAVDSVEFTIPKDPKGLTWAQGCDPHTVTAYVSPNTGKALAVLGNLDFSFLAVVDIEGMLKAPRTGKMVTDPAPFITFIAE